MQELDTANTSKLMTEYEKYEKLQIQIQQQKSVWQKKMDELTTQKEKSMAEVQKLFEIKLAEKQAEIEQVLIIFSSVKLFAASSPNESTTQRFRRDSPRNRRRC